MNIYRLIALIVAVVLTVHLFDAKEAVTGFMNHIFDIPQFGAHGTSTPLFKLAVRMVYLITIVGIIKLIIGKRDSE